jgi:septal ring factor EnvC (AmiA/AmiB activator)
MYDKESMRARLDQIEKLLAAGEPKLAPAQAAIDKLAGQIAGLNAERNRLGEELSALEAPLRDARRERALLVKALGPSVSVAAEPGSVGAAAA